MVCSVPSTWQGTPTNKNMPSNTSRSTAADVKTKTKRSAGAASRSSFASAARFSDLPGLHPATLRALGPEGFGYEFMSAPQASYLPKLLDGSRDFLVRASTGSGKTLGFIPHCSRR